MKILSVSFLVVLVDQFSKYWVRDNLALNSQINIFGNYFRFTHVVNPGIAFGINIGAFMNVITLLSLFAVLLILYYMYLERHSSLLLRVSLALILGGALGNMIDRSFVILFPETYQGVVDFIDIGINQYRWYVFNLADSAVTVGITLYIANSLFSKSKNTASP
ncbi:MAG: signal peptidase II [FCB group bacterium]|nr:signal peptidase II [FCB group bacterium]